MRRLAMLLPVFTVLVSAANGCVGDVTNPPADAAASDTGSSVDDAQTADSLVIDTGKMLVLNGSPCVLSSDCASNCCYQTTLVCGPEVSPYVDTSGSQACTCGKAQANGVDAVECKSHSLLRSYQTSQPANDPCYLACGPKTQGAPLSCYCGRG